ncbi:hypothetical protein L3Q82_012301 [Scortum barcoo]|uniref:Uncharacterized protein n=1 Tax=Scortum barcoo TaxID=214431 RepID=A0ACB8W254_9TELE|nr:hypothetical protein L3Q82_012301 [Scortum barcoo]
MSFFRKIFKNVIHEKDPKDDTVKVKGKEKPKYYGTVTPYPNFSASSDAAVLRDAIKSKGVDEDVIISVLVKRSNEQRQKIKAVYEASNGEKLDQALKKALRSDLEDASLALLMPPAHFDAYLLRKATKGLGTDEHVLVEVLATRTNQEIQDIKRAFKEEYKKELEDVIRNETSGDFTNALLAMLKANKDESTEVNMELAQRDAETLFEAGKNTKNINVSTFIDILTTRNGKQLSKSECLKCVAHLPINTCCYTCSSSVYLAFQNYACVSDVTLPKALDMKLKGDIEDCLIDIVKCAWNTPAFFAEKLHLAMKGLGTREATLTRVLVSRSEVDLKKIVEEYRAMYNISLQESIQVKSREVFKCYCLDAFMFCFSTHPGDTKGHYQAILLGLCGPQ